MSLPTDNVSLIMPNQAFIPIRVKMETHPTGEARDAQVDAVVVIEDTMRLSRILNITDLIRSHVLTCRLHLFFALSPVNSSR